MLKADKERIVDELAAELGSAETLIVADYRGLTNKQLEALRDALLPHGARFRIVKNTLTRRAAEQAGAEALLVMLEGPTAIEIQHLSKIILERVNRFFGWQAVTDLRLRQAPLGRREKPKPPVADHETAAQIASSLTEISDEKLRQALARLGAAIRQP